MYAVTLLRQLVDAFQLRHLLARVGSPLPVRRTFLASQLASFYSLVLPGDIASSGAKWANLSIATGKRSLVLNAMVYNRLVMLTVPVLIGTVALIVDDPFDELWVVLLAVAIFCSLIVLLAMLYHPRLGAWSQRWLERLANRLPERVARKVGYVVGSLGAVRSMPPREHATMFGFVCLSVSLGIVRLWTAIEALDLGVSPFAVLWIMAFALIGRVLPITIASLGIRESLLIVALTPLGVASGQAVALGLLGFTRILLLALIGAAYQIAMVMGWADARSAAPPPALAG